MFGVLCAIIAVKFLKVYFEKKDLNLFKYIFLSSMFIGLSVSCYQAFVSITLAFLYTLIWEQGLKRDIDNIKYFRNIGVSLLSVGIGYIGYSILLKVLLLIRNIELTPYQGMNEMGHITISDTITSVGKAYKEYYNFYITNNFFKIRLAGYANIVLFIILITVLLTLAIKSCKNVCVGRMVWLIILLFMAPVFINNIYLLTQGRTMVYSNMLYTGIVPYLVMIKIIDKSFSKFSLGKGDGYICISMIAFICYLLCNRAYANQEAVLSMEKAYVNRVAMRIKSLEDYNNDTVVYFANPIHMIHILLLMVS